MRDTSGRARQAAIGAFAGAFAGLLFRDLGLQSLVSFWGSRALIVPVALVLGALLGLTRLRVLAPLAATALLVLWTAVAFTPLSAWLAGGLVRRDPPAPADAIIVLGSEIQRDGDLSTNGNNRLLGGVALVRAGLASRIVITEWDPRTTHAAGARRVLDRLGVEVELIVAGFVHDTHDEALLVARLFRERGWHKALLVTSPLHSRRAAATFEAAGVDVISVPSVETKFNVEGLGVPDDRLEAFGSIGHELLGTQVYRWRGWLR